MGYSSGFFVKRVSSLIALAIGGAFVFCQALAYNGYVIINYEKVQKDVEVSDKTLFVII